MDTVAQREPIPYTADHEPEAAVAVAVALSALGMFAYAEYIGSGTPVVVPINNTHLYSFQGWGDADGWYASLTYLDHNEVWQPDEREESTISLPELASITDIDRIARTIYDAVTARHSEE